MTSPGRVAVPIALMVFTMIIVYGALEMSDSEKSALDTLWDMMYGKKEKEKPQDMEISCTGSDQNGFYQMDEDRNCTLKGCYTGYLSQNNACVKRAEFTDNEAVNCEISGYTYSACTPKPNRKCGEGAGTREKYPSYEEFASGGGTCEYSTIEEDCDIECPTTCGLKPEDYSAVAGAPCIGVKSSDGKSITLGVDDGYCGQGTEQLEINISQSVVQEFGFDTVEEYLEYANPNGVCRTTEPTACNVSCDQTDSDGNPLKNIGCNYIKSQYAYISDPEGKAMCFNSQSVNDYLNPTPGATVNKPVPLETIIANDIRNDDLTYDMSRVDDDKKTGHYLLYRSSTIMSYDNLVKNKCHLYKTEPCDAPKESVDCVLENNVPDTCDIFNGCGQSYSKTITRVLEQQAFGDGRTCSQKYGESDYHGFTYPSTDNCPIAKPCCVDSDYTPVGTCNDEGIQTFRLDDAECEKINLLGDESYESPEEVTRPCPVNAVCGWEDYGTCSSEGNQEQTRTTITSAINDGNVCDIVRRFIECDVDCEMNDWTDVANSCNQDPNKPGEKKQTRTVKTERQNEGEACPTDRIRYQNCDVDCEMNDDWTDVANSCNQDPNRPGKRKQTRTVKTERQNNGAVCPTDTRYPNCDVDCVGEWSVGDCSKPCGRGTQTLTWEISTPAQNDGTCMVDRYGVMTWVQQGDTKSQYCNTQECPVPVNCVQSAWENSGVCNSSTGIQSQTRTTTTAAQNSGTACGDLTREIPCDVNCVGDWSGTWSGCSEDCGTGEQTQTWEVSTPAINQGTCVNEGTTKSQPCNTQVCPLDLWSFDNDKVYIRNKDGIYLGTGPDATTARLGMVTGTTNTQQSQNSNKPNTDQLMQQQKFTLDGPLYSATMMVGVWGERACSAFFKCHESWSQYGIWNFVRQAGGGYKIKYGNWGAIQNWDNKLELGQGDVFYLERAPQGLQW